MTINRIVFRDEAIFQTEDVSLIAISDQSYALKKCIIKGSSLQEAVNIAFVVHNGISSEFIKKHCTSTGKQCRGYTEKFSEYRFGIHKDTESDSVVILVKCQKTVLLKKVYCELMFALWRRDEKNFYFQLLAKNVSSLWINPYGLKKSKIGPFTTKL